MTLVLNMNKWIVVSRFRKSGKSIYELSNGIDRLIIYGYNNLLTFLGGAK